MKNLGKTILKVLAIVVIACLAASFILRAFGASDMVVDLIYRLSYKAFIVIVVGAGTLILRSYSEHRWKKKNRAGITEYDKVL